MTDQKKSGSDKHIVLVYDLVANKECVGPTKNMGVGQVNLGIVYTLPSNVIGVL